MAVEAHGGSTKKGLGCGCAGPLRGLPYRTPGQYLAAAKRMQAKGDPRATQAYRAAALAYGVSAAAKKGRTDLVQKGLAGLRELSGGLGTTATLDASQLQSIVNDAIRSAGVDPALLRSLIGGAAATVGGIVGPQLHGNDLTVFNQVMSVIQSVVSGGSITVSIDLSAIAGFCGIYQGVRSLLDGAVTAARRAMADSSDQTVRTIGVVGAVALGVLDGLCSAAVSSGAASAPPPGPCDPASGRTAAQIANDCRCLTCPPGQVKGVTSGIGGACQCMPATTANPAVTARIAYTQALANRKFLEGVLRLPPGPFTAGAQSSNCASACTLLWASVNVLAVTGSIPAVPSQGEAARTRPFAFVDPASDPRCDCTGVSLIGSRTYLPSGGVFTPTPGGGGGGGGGGGAAIAAGAGAALLALYFLA